MAVILEPDLDCKLLQVLENTMKKNLCGKSLKIIENNLENNRQIYGKTGRWNRTPRDR